MSPTQRRELAAGRLGLFEKTKLLLFTLLNLTPFEVALVCRVLFDVRRIPLRETRCPGLAGWRGRQPHS